MPRKLAFPLRRSPKSDPQQELVYRMETEAIGARQYMALTDETIRRLARGVCRNYKVPQAKIGWKDLGRWAAEWEDGVIRLNTRKRSARDVLTITHELAHHIHYHLSDGLSEEQEPHGPQFMACHLSILDTCRVVPVIGMRAICEHYGIRFHDPGTTNSLLKLQRICRKAR